MFSAPCILRGIVGVTVKMVNSTKAEIINFEPVIMAREDTDPKDLEEWHAELLEAFHTQPAKGVGGSWGSSGSRRRRPSS